MDVLNFLMSNNDSAIYYFKKQMHILEKLDSITPSIQFKNDLITAYGNIGVNYGGLSNYLEQLKYYMKAVRLAEADWRYHSACFRCRPHGGSLYCS
jgi:tetratricopeptide (TPR) repeat protein